MQIFKRVLKDSNPLCKASGYRNSPQALIGTLADMVYASD